jgi:hypothetical protein
MTKREKALAAIVGLIVLVMAVVWGANNLSASFEAKNDAIDQLTRDIAEKKGKVDRGKRASAKLAEWQKNSLPSDSNLANSQYWVWLQKVTKKAGLDVEVKPAGPHMLADVYFENKFNVAGKAELPKLISFLHEFYSTGYLHRISSFTAQPVEGTKTLNISMAIDAVSLVKAPKEKDEPPPPAPALAKTSAQYAESILGRNFFWPANNPPKLNSLATQKGNPNRPLTFSVKATDPDKDEVTYSLESPGLEGAKIDPRSGEFRWIPTKLGDTYEIAVRATDNGSPPKSTVEKIKIAVVDPPPVVKENPFAKDDPARDAKISGMVASAGTAQVWVTVPRGMGDQPKTLHLNSGDQISVGSFVGVVKEIRDREAEFQLKDGRTVVVRQGQPLVSSDQRTGI